MTIKSIKDIMGNQVFVGDYIAYAVRYSDSSAMKFGKITFIGTKEKKNWDGDIETQLRVQAVMTDGWIQTIDYKTREKLPAPKFRLNSKVSTLLCWETRMVVLSPSQVLPSLRKQLDEFADSLTVKK